MANVKFSDLPSLAVMTTIAEVPVLEGGATKTITGEVLKTFTRTTDVNGTELLGTTLASNIVNSSLTSVGTLTDLTVSGEVSTTDLTVTNPIIRPVALFSRKHSVAQNTVTDTDTKVLFNTVVDSVEDTGVAYDAVTNPGRFINNSGAQRVFNVSTTVAFASSSTAGSRSIYILKNGTERIAQQLVTATVQNSGTSNQPTIISLSAPIVLADTEYFEVYAWQNSGNPVAIGAAGTFGGSYIVTTWI